MKNWIKRSVVMGVVLAVAVGQPAPALAAGASGSGGGITVDFDGYYENAHNLENIVMMLCDGDTSNSNVAVARFEVLLRNSRGNTYARYAPLVMQIERYGRECKQWRTSIGYADVVAKVRVMFYGSNDPATQYRTAWVSNPHDPGLGLAG